MENEINSVGLYDNISIETWLYIAECVKQLNIMDGNTIEFDENLIKLQEGLAGTEVSLDAGDRYAEHFFYVGLATLLQSIYNIKSNNKKETFLGNIYSLEKLGIRNIQFSGETIRNIISIGNILTLHDYYQKDVIFIHKKFTDGSFCVENVGGYNHMFEMTNLQDVNYLLDIELVSRQDSNLVTKFLGKADATLFSFDSIYPSEEEIMAVHHPNLNMSGSILEWQVTNDSRVKQYFKPYVGKTV